MTKLYAVKDTVAETFGSPMPARNDAVAVRYMVDSMRRQQLSAQAQMEMELWYLGEYDEDTGLLCPATPHRLEVPYAPAKDLTDVK